MPPVPVTVRTAIVNAHEVQMFERSEVLPAERFALTRAAEYVLRLPVASLSAGAYVLRTTASTPDAVAARDVRFTIEPPPR